jgi:hypothetical protein
MVSSHIVTCAYIRPQKLFENVTGKEVAISYVKVKLLYHVICRSYKNNSIYN